MSNIVVFRKHPLIGDNCVASAELVRRQIKADGSAARTMRFGKVGSMVMLNPDPEANPRNERAWFGVLTWIQPQEEVVRRRARLCEVWWVYSRQHLIDAIQAGDSENKEDMLKEIRLCSKKQAWVSNHFSDEPLDSIMTIPTYAEVKKHMKLSMARYLRIDVENDIYDFTQLEY